jgi:hypothetical protein
MHLAQPTAGLGQAAQPPWAFWPTVDKTGGESPLMPMAYWPNPADRQSLVGGEATREQTRSTVIPIWGEGRREAHRSSVMTAMAVRRRGAPVRESVSCRWLGW